MNRDNKFKEMGLKDERYRQMMKSFDNNEKLIQDAIEEWGIENVNKGYAIFDFDCTGMLQIEEIGATDAFGCDDDKATKQAMKDGIKIIPINELPKNFDRKYLGWIDTPENRKAIEEYCQNESNYYCNGNSLK